MRRVCFCVGVAAALLFAGGACERHSVAELDAEHGGVENPAEHTNPLTTSPEKKAENVEAAPAPAAPAPAPEAAPVPAEKKPEAPKFFPDSN